MAANTNTLSLQSVLEKDKLNGLNFLDWFRNLRIVLKQEQKLYVIEQSFPNEPPANASRADRDVYKKHLDNMVRLKPILMVRNNKGKGKAKVQTKPKAKGRPKPGKGKAALKPIGGVSKEGDCFHCGVTGHWKRNCPIYLKEIKNAKTSGTFASGTIKE
ncbi:hypothetical protein J1N35_018864 [Gossypium stocksii]|uniref:CCHC-type domain-containing protein n=1 Tax=Gossypium stocksii TaxID=47602 RepID=A0A9D3VQV6_9ROSI|nr:hypothetical protein J1N35_018864 [Gossypium stocksii]